MIAHNFKHNVSWLKYILMFFIINVTLAHFAYNVLDFGGDRLTTLIQYIDWMIFSMFALMFKRVKKHYIFAFFVLFSNELVASYMGSAVFNIEPLSHIYNIFLISSAIIFSLGVNWSSSITESDTENVLFFIFILGISSCVYAMVTQSDIMRQILSGVHAGWGYISFFGQRNKFAVFCYLSIICGTFLLCKERKIIYIAGIALLFISIIFTDSRNSYFSVILFWGLYFVFRNKLSISKLIILSLPIIVVIAHKGSSSGVESDQRFILWTMGISKMYEHGVFLTGFGVGASGNFLLHYFPFGSFHNVYMDLFFDGGIVRLLVYLIAVYVTYRNICRHPDILYRNLMKAAFLSFSFYCIFEAGAMMFCANFFSVITTTMFAILPWYRKEK